MKDYKEILKEDLEKVSLGETKNKVMERIEKNALESGQTLHKKPSWGIFRKPRFLITGIASLCAIVIIGTALGLYFTLGFGSHKQVPTYIGYKIAGSANAVQSYYTDNKSGAAAVPVSLKALPLSEGTNSGSAYAGNVNVGEPINLLLYIDNPERDNIYRIILLDDHCPEHGGMTTCDYKSDGVKHSLPPYDAEKKLIISLQLPQSSDIRERNIEIVEIKFLRGLFREEISADKKNSADANIVNENGFTEEQKIKLYVNRQLNLTYRYNNGQNDSSALYPENNMLQPVTPERTGYTFNYWYENDENIPYDSDIMPSQDLTLNAKWTVNRYTAQFISRLNNAPDSLTQDYDSILNLPKPEHEEYQFKYWTLNNEKFTSDKMPAQNITLTAEWGMKGDGTVNAPYEIYNLEQFEQIRSNLDKHFILKRDIDLGGQYFESFGTWNIQAGNQEFTGVFDGNKKTISNYTSPHGIFYKIAQNGTVKNLTTAGDSQQGGIAAMNSGKILNCVNLGNITGTVVGGIAAQNEGIIENCCNLGTVSAKDSAGGITAINVGDIKACYNGGNIASASASIAHSGGIAAFFAGIGVISDCYNYGTIASTSSSRNGASYAGGIAGEINVGNLETDRDNNLINCFNVGQVFSSCSNYACAGSIYGYWYDYYTKDLAVNCYWLDIVGDDAVNGRGGPYAEEDIYCVKYTDIADMKTQRFTDLLNGSAGSDKWVYLQGNLPKLYWQI